MEYWQQLFRPLVSQFADKFSGKKPFNCFGWIGSNGLQGLPRSSNSTGFIPKMFTTVAYASEL